MAKQADAHSPDGDSVRAIGRVRLRVRNLSESRRFYERLMGLTNEPDDPSDVRLHLTNDHGNHPWHFDLELHQGVSHGTRPSIEHFSFRVSGEEALKALHARAKRMGVESTEPRFVDGEWRFFAYDPDGHKIGVYAFCETAGPASHKD
jgi:catechol 2,3-dioxygenase-like lactoylglutathione lyase family enzyme